MILKKNNSLNCEGIFKDYSDNTIKVVFSKKNKKKEIIEMTFIDNKNSSGVDVFCVPTHHYCNLGCKFCHLTQENKNRGMLPITKNDFIEALIRTVYKGAPKIKIENKKIRFVKKNIEKRSKNKKCLISFMGVGEPLLNLKLLEEIYYNENIIKKICEYDEIGYAIATMMPNNNIKKISDLCVKKNFPMKIHFSMHSPFSRERKKLLPKTNINVEEALKLLTEYEKSISKNNKIKKNLRLFHSNHIQPIEIHYTLIKNINDSEKHLEKIIQLLKKYKISFKILKFNAPIGMEESKKVSKWLKELTKKLPKIKILQYSPPGKAVGSSCGEFTKHYYLSEIESPKEKKEFLEWKKKHQIFE